MLFDAGVRASGDERQRCETFTPRYENGNPASIWRRAADRFRIAKLSKPFDPFRRQARGLVPMRIVGLRDGPPDDFVNVLIRLRR